MKRFFLLTTLMLASVTFGCQGMGPAGTPGSGSSFQGGTEAGNPPTDGGFLGGTEAGNPPTGEQGTGTGIDEHHGQTAGNEYCSVNNVVVHCSTCIDGKTADGKEDCTPIDIDTGGLDLDPEHMHHLNPDSENDGSEQRSISPDALNAIGQYVGDLGGAQPIQKDKPVLKMPSSGSNTRIRIPLPPDPED